MNNQTIRFLSVTIRNFRGIPNELVIPLDSPLTVIKAANGTGKSTICHALEWLLTGTVEDLPKNIDYACQWGDGDTCVSASCFIGELYYEISRNNKSLWCLKGIEEKYKIKDADLLDLLTPNTVSGGTPQAIGKAKRGWLRNSRWLYSNSLALMVDNNKAEERQQIFADILGLGHITDMLRELRDYRRELPSIKGLQNTVDSMSDEISTLRNMLKNISPRVEEAANALSEIFEAFPEITATGRLEEDFKAAQLPAKLFEQRSSRAIETLRELSGGWEQFIGSQSQLISIRQDLTELRKLSEVLRAKYSELTLNASTSNVKVREAERAVNWATQHLELLNRWEEIASNIAVAEYLNSNEIEFQQLKEIFVEFSWSSEKQKEWLQSIMYISQHSNSLDALVKQKNDLLANVIQLPADIVILERIAEEATGKRSKAEAEFNALSSLLEKLKAMGKGLVQSHNGQNCPLCNHDWGSSQALHEQVFADHFLIPELSKADQELVEARKLESDCLEKIYLANNQKKAHETYVARVRAVDEELEIFAKQTNYLEIMCVSDFMSFDSNNLVYLRARVEFSMGFSKIIESLNEVLSVIKLEPIAGVRSRVLAVREELAEYLKHYKEQEEEARLDINSINDQKHQLADSIQANAREIDEVNINISALLKTTDSFMKQWSEVVGDVPVTRESYSSRLDSVNEEIELSRKYKGILSECEAVVDIDLDKARLNRLDNNVKEMSRRLASGKHRIAIADQTIEDYALHVKDQTTKSLAPLLIPANEIFSRLHANEVYQGLSVSDGVAGFKWTAVTNDDSRAMDTEEKFSQGQRQDLALSLFLARAKNIEGSFVLDEPFAHLDDLNRVAMLDIFRLIATSMNCMNIIITTANDGLARHMSQKFSNIKDRHLLNTIYLEGNPRTGVDMSIVKNISN